MIRRENLPEDAAEWKSIDVPLPKLANDSPLGCPSTEEEIFEYVQIESADTGRAQRDRLIFLRTAQLGGAKIWLWSYLETDGQQEFVTCICHTGGDVVLSLSSPNGLSEEQYMLAEYYGEVYWS